MESKLRDKRKKAGLTRSELARLSGVNVKSIELYEYHPEKILNASISNVMKLTNALGCEIEDIVEVGY